MTIEISGKDHIDGKSITLYLGTVEAHGSTDLPFGSEADLVARLRYEVEQQASYKGANAIINLSVIYAVPNIPPGKQSIQVKGTAVKTEWYVYTPTVEPEKKSGCGTYLARLVRVIVILFLLFVVTISLILLIVPIVSNSH